MLVRKNYDFSGEMANLKCTFPPLLMGSGQHGVLLTLCALSVLSVAVKGSGLLVRKNGSTTQPESEGGTSGSVV